MIAIMLKNGELYLQRRFLNTFALRCFGITNEVCCLVAATNFYGVPNVRVVHPADAVMK